MRGWVVAALVVAVARARSAVDNHPLMDESAYKELTLKRRLQFPECADLNEDCPRLASPQLVDPDSLWDDEFNVWSDKGYCNIAPAQGYMFANCQRSCGLCASSCVDENDEAGSDTCASLLAAEPDACTCPEDGSCTGVTHGEISVLWMRNWCAKTCHENGQLPGPWRGVDFPGTYPCTDPCARENHPCASIPFTVGGRTYDKCTSLKSSSGRRPKGADKHGTARGESDLKWCPIDGAYSLSNKDMDWSYCSCINFSSEGGPPTPQPTIPPTDSSGCPFPTNKVFLDAVKDQCGSRNTCTVDLTEVEDKTIALCAAYEVGGNKDITIVDRSANGTTFVCEESTFITKPLFTFSLKPGAKLTLDGVGVRECRLPFRQQQGSSLTVRNAVVADNVNTNGPGVVLLDGPDCTFDAQGMTVRNNTGSFAGVLDMSNKGTRQTIRVADSSFVDNESSFNGGVFQISNDLVLPVGSLEVTNCTFRGNRAGGVGGVFSIGSSLIRLNAVVEDSVFEDNRAVDEGGVLYLAGADSFELTDNSFLDDPLEDRVLRFTFRRSRISNSFAGLGGVISTFQNGNNEVVFEDCEIDGSRADFGGVVDSLEDFSDPAEDFEEDTTVSVSFVRTTISNNAAQLNGGVATLGGHVRIRFDGCTVADNEAVQFGGVVGVSDQGGTVVDLTDSTFQGNRARQFGGVIAMQSWGSVTANNSVFLDNSAQEEGGVLYGSPIAKVDVGDSVLAVAVLGPATVLRGNSAGICGGAFALRGASQLDVGPGVRLEANAALRGSGGGLCLRNAAAAALDGVSAVQNTASEAGGAAFVSRDSALQVSGGSFSGNIAGRYGGALGIEFGGDVAVGGGTEFRSNVIYTIAQGGGGAIGLIFVPGQFPKVTVANATFAENRAMTGSDVFVDEPENLALSSPAGNEIVVSYLFNETFSGDAVFRDCVFEDESVTSFSTLPFQVKLFYSNSTTESGVPNCEVLGTAFDDVDPSLPHLTVFSGQEIPTFCAATVDSFGRLIPVPQDYTLSLQVAALPQDRDVVDLPGAQVKALSLRETVELDYIEIFAKEGNYSMRVVPSAVFHLNNTFYDKEAYKPELRMHVAPCNEGDVLVDHPNSFLKKCVPSNDLIVPGRFFPDPTNLSISELCPAGFHRPPELHALRCYECEIGFVATPDRSQCNKCETLFALSWNSTKQTCDPCPEGAFCLGGERVVPEPGFYHSSMRAYQFHKCLSVEACDFPGRSERLEKIRNATGTVALVQNRVLQAVGEDEDGEVVIGEDAYRDAQCAEGYQGPICGACSEGYQRKSLTECAKCSEKWKNAVFFAVTFCLLLVFLIFTVYKAFYKKDATSNAVKVVVAFIQQVSVLNTFRVGWPKSVNGLISFASGISSGEITSIGCLFENEEIPAFAIKAIVTIYVVPPALMILIPLILWVVRKAFKSAKKVTVKMRRENVVVIVIIIYFFLYPFIVIETITLFSCIPIDDTSKPDPYVFNLLRPGQYLLVDTNEECWSGSGWHRSAALGVGVPSLLIFVLGLPTLLISYLYRNKHRFHERDFHERYGFIYVGLKDDKWFFFFIALARTSILGMIGMLVTDPGYQNLVGQLWLVMYLIMIIFMNPFQLRTILFMDVVSTICILLLLYYNMWMLQIQYALGSIDEYDTTFSVLIVVTIVGGLIALVWMGTLAYVGVAEGVNPSDLRFRDVHAHFKGLGEKTVSLAKSRFQSIKKYASGQGEEARAASDDGKGGMVIVDDDDGSSRGGSSRRMSFLEAADKIDEVDAAEIVSLDSAIEQRLRRASDSKTESAGSDGTAASLDRDDTVLVSI